MKENIYNQGGAIIRTLNPNPVAHAFIYCEEQRAKIVPSNFNHITYFTIA